MRTDRIRLKDLITMPDEEFSDLVDRATLDEFDGASMATILKLAQDRRIMSPPRRPRGEKPATTIRVQARQLKELQQIITGLRSIIADKDKVIVGYDSQLQEANEDCARLRRLCADRTSQLAEANQKNRRQAERLAFLEGYYEKSKEGASLPVEEISRSIGVLAGDPAQANTGRRAGNPQNHQTQFARTVPFENGPTGFDEGFGAAVQRQSADHQAHSRQRPVEHVKVTTNSNEWNANADGSPIRGAGR